MSRGLHPTTRGLRGRRPTAKPQAWAILYVDAAVSERVLLHTAPLLCLWLVLILSDYCPLPPAPSLSYENAKFWDNGQAVFFHAARGLDSRPKTGILASVMEVKYF